MINAVSEIETAAALIHPKLHTVANTNGNVCNVGNIANVNTVAGNQHK